MQANKQIKFILQGVQIPITPLMFREMKFFQQWQVLSSSQADSFELPQKSVVTLGQWKIIIQILEHFKYQLPSLPKVRTTDPYSIVGAFLTDKFKAMNRTQMNRLYVAAHFLKIKNLRASIAAYYATQVYFQGEKDYDERLKENKVKRPLTAQLFNSYRQHYPFLNHY